MDLDFSWNLVIDTNSLNNRGSVGRNFNLQVLRGTSVVVDKFLFTLGGAGSSYTYQGTFGDIASVESAYPGSWDTLGYWVIIDNIVWVVTYNGHGGYWRNTGQSAFEFFRETYKGSLQISLLNGDKVRIVCKQDTGKRKSVFTLYTQSLIFSWKSRGVLCDIPSFKPKTLAETLIKKMAGDDLRVEVSITDFDLRLANTVLMAAENVRGIDGAKLYSSFNEFTDWMSAVFGYVYEIGELQHTPYDKIVNIGECFYTQKSFVSSMYEGEVDMARVVYMESRGMFFYNAPDGNYYIAWDGYLDYVSSSSRPKPGILYNFSNIGLCVFDFNDDGSLASNTPVASGLTTDNALLDWQPVKFLHRSELFSGVVSKDIGNVLDLSYTVTSSSIYSTIEAGYEEKDYDSINGRDEFNFTNVYSTGCTATDKKLSLISKYRADCYGLEFAAQKRGEDTTDSTSDNDVFFVYCSVSGTDYSPARSCSIENALSDTVFNGEFSPMACVRANAGYIGMQEADMQLAFASSTGNSSIVIDGESISSDITLGEPLMTCGVIEFTTDDQEVTANLNNAVRLKSNGIEYVGYISDLDLKYARPEPASYKLLVKSISLS
ncbi:MAG: hypothetical protein LUD17_05300 [Bacteroidales bacterium]|nr:hypothetical protein [Bacteroidales bacterium]